MTATTRTSARLIPGSIIAIIAWAALGLQFLVLQRNARADGVGFVTGTLNYISYFTILSNLMVALATSLPVVAPVSRAGRFFARPSVTSAIAVYIVIVGLVYSVVLRRLWDPTGLQKVLDHALHDVTPMLYVMHWWRTVPAGSLRWRDLPRWLLIPAVYAVWTMVRGAFTTRYPYPFLDVGQLGYPLALLNAAGVLAGFLVISAIVVIVNRSRAAAPATGVRSVDDAME
jgi:hypothetical protein